MLGTLYICDACEGTQPGSRPPGWAGVLCEHAQATVQCDVCPACTDKPLRQLLVEIAARFRARGTGR